MRYRGSKPFSGKELSVQGESQDCCSLSAIHSEAFVICMVVCTALEFTEQTQLSLIFNFLFWK